MGHWRRVAGRRVAGGMEVGSSIPQVWEGGCPRGRSIARRTWWRWKEETTRESVATLYLCSVQYIINSSMTGYFRVLVLLFMTSLGD